MGLIREEFNTQEEVTNRYEITINDEVAVYCFASQNKNVDFKYIIKIADQDLYSSNKEYCDEEIKKFLDKIISIQQSEETLTEKQEEIAKYILV